MAKPSNLDDPAYAAFAWARYRRLMKFMALFALVCIAVALTLLYVQEGHLPILAALFVAGGVGASVMLMAALMGLVFLSSGTGHDEAIDDRWETDIRSAHGLDDAPPHEAERRNPPR